MSVPCKIETLLPALFLMGCTSLGPSYAPPEPAALPHDGQLIQSFTDTSEVLTAWWTEFGDERLDSLVEAALLQNRDLASAQANLRAARANLRLEELGRLPTDQLSVSANTAQQSEAVIGFPGVGEQVETYSISYAPRWDLDLFGAIGRQIEIAAANYEAQLEQMRSLQLIIIGDVATNYFNLQSLQLEREIIGRNIAIQEDSLRITEARFENGRVTEADVLNARAQLGATRANLPNIEASMHQIEARLSVLTGKVPGALAADLTDRSAAGFISAPLPIGTLEDLLRRQPAIRASERALSASVSEIGLSISSLFPTVSLVGSIGFSAQDIGDIGGDDALMFSVGPSLVWSPTNLIRGRQSVQASKARSDAAYADYEQTVLRVLEDFQTALALQAAARARRAALISSLEASKEAARIARVQYQFGAVPFNSVLDAEARLLERELDAGRNSYDIIIAQIAVFRALGAG